MQQMSSHHWTYRSCRTPKMKATGFKIPVLRSCAESGLGHGKGDFAAVTFLAVSLLVAGLRAVLRYANLMAIPVRSNALLSSSTVSASCGANAMSKESLEPVSFSRCLIWDRAGLILSATRFLGGKSLRSLYGRSSLALRLKNRVRSRGGARAWRLALLLC